MGEGRGEGAFTVIGVQKLRVPAPLDSSSDLHSILTMKLSVPVLAVLLSCSPLLAQQQHSDVIPSGPDSAVAPRNLSEALSEKAPQENAHITVGKRFQVNGPLAQPFKTHKLRTLPRRLFHWINPFAPSERQEEVLRSRDYDTRPWSSTEAWRSGGPWFPNEAYHEGGLSVISVHRSSE